MSDFLKMRPIEKVVVASAARTATGNSGDLDNASGSLPMFAASISLILSVTAASGTSPTLDVTLEHAPDGSTWINKGFFTQCTAANIYTAEFKNYLGEGDGATEAIEVTAGTFLNGPMATTHRIVWTIGGTNPSFTFSVMSVAMAAV